MVNHTNKQVLSLTFSIYSTSFGYFFTEYIEPNIFSRIKSSLLQSRYFLFFSIAQSCFPLPSFIVSAVKYQSHTLFAFQKRKSYLEPSCIAWHGTFNPPVDLHLIFWTIELEKSCWTNLIFGLFQTWIFRATQGVKIKSEMDQVQMERVHEEMNTCFKRLLHLCNMGTELQRRCLAC